MKNQIQIAAKLYDTRDTMRRFYGDRYAGKIAEYQQHIRDFMAKRECNEIEAAMDICTILERKMDNPGMALALTLAAAVEMIEPSNAGIAI